MQQNLHTHTTYCDGKDTPREMVNHAIALGFDSLGFSGHSHLPYPKDWCMTPEGEMAYIQEIRQLKEEWKDRFPIYCGIEFDIFSDTDLSGFDYSIGSVHGLLRNGDYLEFDLSADEVATIIQESFHGDGMAYAKAYYETLAAVPRYGDFDILGHFDIITKHAEHRKFFDWESKEYLGYAFDAARALQGKIPLFEVNTGAISRGYRTTPYPSIPILKELCRLGFRAVVTSDCHDGTKLDCCYTNAIELLKHCGFQEHYILTDSGFTAVGL